MFEKIKEYCENLKWKKAVGIMWGKNKGVIEDFINTIFIVCFILKVKCVYSVFDYEWVIDVVCLLGIIHYSFKYLLFEALIGVLSLFCWYCMQKQQIGITKYDLFLVVAVFSLLNFISRLRNSYIKVSKIQCPNGFRHKKEYKIYKKVVCQNNKICLADKKGENVEDNFGNYLEWKEYFISNFIKDEVDENFKVYLTNMKRERGLELSLTNSMLVPLVITLYSMFWTWEQGEAGFLLIYAGVLLFVLFWFLYDCAKKEQFYEDCLKIVEEIGDKKQKDK